MENTVKEEDFITMDYARAAGSGRCDADSVGTAVRSAPDKTIGKIEGLARKIIKDKLDDGIA